MCAKSECSFLCRAKTGCVSGKAGRLACLRALLEAVFWGISRKPRGLGVSQPSRTHVSFTWWPSGARAPLTFLTRGAVGRASSCFRCRWSFLFVLCLGRASPSLGGCREDPCSQREDRETLELFSELQLFFQLAPKPAFSQIHPSVYCSPCFSLSATSI